MHHSHRTQSLDFHRLVYHMPDISKLHCLQHPKNIFVYMEIYDCKGPNLTKIAINDEMNDLLLMMASPSETLTFTGNCCLTILAGFGLMGCMRGLPGPGPALGGSDDVGWWWWWWCVPTFSSFPWSSSISQTYLLNQMVFL